MKNVIIAGLAALALTACGAKEEVAVEAAPEAEVAVTEAPAAEAPAAEVPAEGAAAEVAAVETPAAE